MVRVCVFSKYDEQGASSRVRLYGYADRFRKAGIEPHYYPLLDGQYLRNLYAGRPRDRLHLMGRLAGRLGQLTNLRKFDILWIEYELFPYLPSVFERLVSRPFVLDFDDAIFHNYDMSPSPLVRGLLGRKIDVAMARASAVTVGNSYLAGRAEAAGARRILNVPTPIEAARVVREPPAAQPLNGPLRIGWIGTPVTARYLSIVRDAIAEVARRQPVEIVLIGTATSPLDGLPVRYVPWTLATEAESLAAIDVGIMPLDKTPWSLGKCSFKLLQYMASGKPVIASPVGMNNDVVRPDVNGFHATDTASWVMAFERLAGDPALRARLGAGGRDLVLSQYTYDATAPRLVALFQELVAEQRSPSVMA
ncbi:MAG: glycosyltransferase [Rhizobiales bacterium]|nr:glycosyltransferase [Hyphomicrobiales bacterium]